MNWQKVGNMRKVTENNRARIFAHVVKKNVDFLFSGRGSWQRKLSCVKKRCASEFQIEMRLDFL
jgi:hypothetical protein